MEKEHYWVREILIDFLSKEDRNLTFWFEFRLLLKKLGWKALGFSWFLRGKGQKKNVSVRFVRGKENLRGYIYNSIFFLSDKNTPNDSINYNSVTTYELFIYIL